MGRTWGLKTEIGTPILRKPKPRASLSSPHLEPSTCGFCNPHRREENRGDINWQNIGCPRYPQFEKFFLRSFPQHRLSPAVIQFLRGDCARSSQFECVETVKPQVNALFSYIAQVRAQKPSSSTQTRFFAKRRSSATDFPIFAPVPLWISWHFSPPHRAAEKRAHSKGPRAVPQGPGDSTDVDRAATRRPRPPREPPRRRLPPRPRRRPRGRRRKCGSRGTARCSRCGSQRP